MLIAFIARSQNGINTMSQSKTPSQKVTRPLSLSFSLSLSSIVAMCRDTCSCHQPRQWSQEGPALREHLDLRGDGTVLLMIYEPVVVSEALVAELQPHAKCSAYLVLAAPEMDRLVLQASKYSTPLGKALLRFAGSRAGLSKPDPRIGADVPLARLPVDGTLAGILHQVDGVGGGGGDAEDDEQHPYGRGLVGDLMEQRRLAHRAHSTDVFTDLEHRLEHIAAAAQERQNKGATIIADDMSSLTSASVTATSTNQPDEPEFHDNEEAPVSTSGQPVAAAAAAVDEKEQERRAAELAAIEAHATHCRRLVAGKFNVKLHDAPIKSVRIPDIAAPVCAAGKVALAKAQQLIQETFAHKGDAPPVAAAPVSKFAFCSAEQLTEALVNHERHLQDMPGSTPLAAAAAAAAAPSPADARLITQGFNRWQ
jgi:hypothetical protein